MRSFIFIPFILLLWGKNSGNLSKVNTRVNLPSSHSQSFIADITVNPGSIKTHVLILPPYDVIANEGISPDIQKYLEEELSKDTSLIVIKFPYKKLMHVPYQNVFDKKYCKPITDKVKTDIVLMTKLDQVTGTGDMTKDKWNVVIRVFNLKNNKQTNSKIQVKGLTSNEIKRLLSARHNDLAMEIKNNR
jgi:hypothetical protein